MKPLSNLKIGQYFGCHLREIKLRGPSPILTCLRILNHRWPRLRNRLPHRIHFIDHLEGGDMLLDFCSDLFWAETHAVDVVARSNTDL
jgi:hypothetical protein